VRRFILAGAALLALALARNAAAQDVPALRPTHDVAVVYKVAGSPPPSGVEQAHTIYMIWGSEGRELRVQVDRQPTVVLVDFARQLITMLVEPQRLAIVFTLDPRLIPGFIIPPDATVTRAGTDTVAGLTCEVWKLTGPRGSGRACVTPDGLLLRASGSVDRGGTGRLEAVSVVYGPQPASLFTPPPDFRRMDLQTARR
jgi:hypothetical protein